MKIVIPITPHPQPRPRFARRGKYVVTYKGAKHEQIENELVSELMNVPHDKLENCGVIVGFIAYLPIPASKPKWWKIAADAGEIHHITKPDIDNLEKFLFDCMKQAGYFGDDTQIYNTKGEKRYSFRPRWEIEITSSEQITKDRWRFVSTTSDIIHEMASKYENPCYPGVKITLNGEKQ